MAEEMSQSAAVWLKRSAMSYHLGSLNYEISIL